MLNNLFVCVFWVQRSFGLSYVTVRYKEYFIFVEFNIGFKLELEFHISTNIQQCNLIYSSQNVKLNKSFDEISFIKYSVFKIEFSVTIDNVAMRCIDTLDM